MFQTQAVACLCEILRTEVIRVPVVQQVAYLTVQILLRFFRSAAA